MGAHAILLVMSWGGSKRIDFKQIDYILIAVLTAYASNFPNDGINWTGVLNLVRKLASLGASE